MKSILTLSLSFFIVITAFAQYGQVVTVSLAGRGNGNGNNNNNAGVEVVIDGRNYSFNNYQNNSNGNGNNGRWNNNGDNSITLPNFQPGQHSLVVNRVRYNGKYGSVNANNQPAYSSTFLVKQGYDLDIAIRENGEVKYVEKPANSNGRRSNEGYRDRRENRDDDHRNNGDYNRGNNGGYSNRNNNNGGYNNRYPNNESNMRAMADASFNQIYQHVKGKWFQSAKVTAVREAFDNNNNFFSTYQIRQLLALISSENNRLDLAKASYKNVVDKAYFNQLYDLFSKQANRDDLDRFIRSSRY